MAEAQPRTFFAMWADPFTIRRASMVGIIVGTILIAINQGDLLLDGQMPPLWKIILTYLVPFCVSSYSTAASLADFAQGTIPPLTQEN